MRVTFNCKACGVLVAKTWSSSMPGKPTFCSRKCKGVDQSNQKPVTRDWLVQKYVTEGMDCTQIAAIVKRDPKTVWSWLRFYSIPTRKRGHASAAYQFQKGDESLFKGRKHSVETRERIRQIAIETGRVPYDPAVGSYMKGRTGSLHPQWKGGITPERQALYSSKAWAGCVALVWARAESKCERCGVVAERRSRKFHIHHIVPFEYEPLRADVGNLMLLCVKCHMYVHSTKNTSGEFIKPAPTVEGTNP